MAAADHRVPIEYVGRARALRDRIAKAQGRYGKAIEELTRGLRPRPGWPPPTHPKYLRKLALAVDLTARGSICSLFSEVQTGKQISISISDLVVTAEDLMLPGWSEPEPALRVVLHIIECRRRPFSYSYSPVPMGLLGLHALARRFQRGRPNSDDAVLADLRCFVGAFRRAIRTQDEEFRIEIASGGAWLGQLSADGNAIVARTFVN
jgi:hypothetical protein